jgi:uncharacterized protein
MHCPHELATPRAIRLHNGVFGRTTDVWHMLEASANGDVAAVQNLVSQCPEYAYCQFDYTAPLHFAVRENQLHVADFLIRAGALDPAYRTHPFQEPLTLIARERGHRAMLELLTHALADNTLCHTRGDSGGVLFARTDESAAFERAVDQGAHDAVRAMLRVTPGLALDPTAFWGEGILAAPANGADAEMLAILLDAGARVPEYSKWGARYYAKHRHVTEFLLAHGMSPNHRNWREFTLLHDMAHTGDAASAQLLIDVGAQLNPIDDEYRATPLGWAARFGHTSVANVLCDAGADLHLAGAPWATPLGWAELRGHTDIASMLRARGASH